MKQTWETYKRIYFAAYRGGDVAEIDRLTLLDPEFATYCETDIQEGRIPVEKVAKPKGRPKTGRAGGSRWIYIGETDWARLQALGNGSASAGIRKLLGQQTSSEAL
jgi:hypothetical protein